MVCRTSIAGTFETGQSAVRIDLIEREGEKAARLQLFLPVGLYLQAGVKITIDQGAAYRIPYMWCLTNTCIAADVADPKLLKEMETGHKLLLEVVDSSVLSVTTTLPIDQFAAVRQGHSGADVRTGYRRVMRTIATRDLYQTGRRFFDRLEQRPRPKWLRQIGNASGFHRGHADSGVVIRRDVDDRQGNSGRLETMPQLNPQLLVQVDVENQTTGRVEIAVIPERFRRRKQNAVVTVFT